jgi:4'-phosphopantetheinyl transferase
VDVYWLAQTAQDVPAGNAWLSAREALRLDGMRFPKRRADWRLGRWTAKCAVSAYLNLPRHPEALAAIEVWPAPSGAPEIHIANRPAAVTISLSHSGCSGFCAVAGPGTELGCDVETVEPRSRAFLADYFTPEEKLLVARTPAAERDRLLTLLWSAKESVLKALRCGLRSDTLCVSTVPVDALPPHPEWRPLSSTHTGGRTFHGWWRETNGLVWTLVADNPVLVRQADNLVVNLRRIVTLPAAAVDNSHATFQTAPPPSS